ncbi:hypothetical protein DFH09DRAFT_1096767 [Mycena vulgaris]|nr:hypothetical protein DFH09DRAFT_1096767 [Mycena vulgaris]
MLFKKISKAPGHLMSNAQRMLPPPHLIILLPTSCSIERRAFPQLSSDSEDEYRNMDEVLAGLKFGEGPNTLRLPSWATSTTNPPLSSVPKLPYPFRSPSRKPSVSAPRLVTPSPTNHAPPRPSRPLVEVLRQLSLGREVAHEPFEPAGGFLVVRKQMAPTPKHDVKRLQWLRGAIRLPFLRTVRKPPNGSNGSRLGAPACPLQRTGGAPAHRTTIRPIRAVWFTSPFCIRLNPAQNRRTPPDSIPLLRPP